MNFLSLSNIKHLLKTSTSTPLTLATALIDELRDAGSSLLHLTNVLTHLTTACTLLNDLPHSFYLYTDPDLYNYTDTDTEVSSVQRTAKDIYEMCTLAAESPSERTSYMTAIHDAASALNAEIEVQTDRYYDNMTILLSQTKKKMRRDNRRKGDHEWTIRRLGRSGIDSARALKDLVWEWPKAEYHKGYLSEIARYWRRWGGTAEARPYEEIWTYVSGRVLVQE